MTNIVTNTNGKKKNPWLRGLIAACLALVLLGAGAGGGMWYQANWAVASIISLDVNPSIELRVNQNEKVLACAALNEDAAAILAEMGGGKDLEGAKLDVAVNAIVGALVRHGYLDSLSSAILISVEDNNTTRAVRLQQQLTATVDGILQTSSSQAAVYSQNMTVDAGLDAQAQANSISSGKAALVSQVIALNGSLPFEELAKLTVEELRDLIQIGAPAMPIGKAAAMTAAEEYAGTLALDSVVAEADPEIDEIVPCYEVKLHTQSGEFEYVVDAFTGEVLSGVPNILHIESTVPDGGASTQTTGNPAPGLTGEEALDAALAHFGGRYPELAGYHILSPKVDFDQEDNHIDVEFWCAGYEFDYTLNYTTGEVLGVDTDYRTPAPDTGTTPPVTSSPALNSSDAFNAAVAAFQADYPNAAGYAITPIQNKYDPEDNDYEVEFSSAGGYRAEYTIDAATGKVLDFEVQPVQSTSTPPTAADIGVEAAKAAALNHAGAAGGTVTWLKAQKDWDDGRAEYELEFLVERSDGAIEYDYTIDAATGAVLDWDSEYATVNDPAPGAPTQPSASDIGMDAAKAAALRHVGAAESAVTWLKAQKDWDDGRAEYELEFLYNGTEYDYTIAAADGAVLKCETEALPQSDTSGGTGSADIGSDAALAAALDHAGFSASQVSHLNCEREREHGRIEYEIEFKCNGYEYEYTIDGETGAVLDHECDRDD